MTTWFSFYAQLVAEFGQAGAALVLIYGGLLALLLLSIAVSGLRPIVRRRRVRRFVQHEAAERRKFDRLMAGSLGRGFDDAA